MLHERINGIELMEKSYGPAACLTLAEVSAAWTSFGAS